MPSECIHTPTVFSRVARERGDGAMSQAVRARLICVDCACKCTMCCSKTATIPKSPKHHGSHHIGWRRSSDLEALRLRRWTGEGAETWPPLFMLASCCSMKAKLAAPAARLSRFAAALSCATGRRWNLLTAALTAQYPLLQVCMTVPVALTTFIR